MSDHYTPLFSSIITSSIWQEDNETRLLWLTMLAVADENDQVLASVTGLAFIARISEESCRKALDIFLSPDPNSRTKEHEGRRIAEIDGGWLLLNRAKHRKKLFNRTEYMRDYMRKRRENEDLLNKKSNSVNSKLKLDNVDVDVDVNNTKKKEKKEKHLDCVLLTKEEFNKLVDRFGLDDTDKKIETLNDYIMSKGKRYKSHYHTILSWSKKDTPAAGTASASSASAKTKLFPIAGRNCSINGCCLPAVYKVSGAEYDSYRCGEHLPASVKEKYTW